MGLKRARNLSPRMIVRNSQDFKKIISPPVRLLGLDVGSRTLGLAVADPGWMVASPIKTLERKKFSEDIVALRAVMEEYKIGGLVLGLPVNMDGTEGPMAQSVQQFAKNLIGDARVGDIPVLLWDERWSTQAVNRLMIDWDMTRQKRDKAVDKMAAAYILQGALDALRR